MAPSLPRNRRIPRTSLALALLLGCLGAFAPVARAQTTIQVAAGLGGISRANTWLPVNLQLDHQGPAAEVEIRGYFLDQLQPTLYSLPARLVQPGTSQRHTLYLYNPEGYGANKVRVDLLVNGKNVYAPKGIVIETRRADPGTELLVHLSKLENRLGSLAGQLPNGLRLSPNYNRYGNSQTLMVASVKPEAAPDQWYGYDAASVVVLGDVSERELTETQREALRDWVRAGGSLVVSGGLNWNRLTTPFFTDLLPVQVTGSSTLTNAPSLADVGGARGPSGTAFAAVVGKPKPGAQVLARGARGPLVVHHRYGSGHVSFLAFDPAEKPFRAWEGNSKFWPALMKVHLRQGSIVAQLAQTESVDYYPYQSQVSGLAAAPMSIQELDIPGFDFVALLLLAYVICLVPINYLVLRKLDKKEWAWVTTPVIVAVFSFIAYGVAYGQKGGRAVLVPVSVVEAYAGQPAAPSILFAGLFSPGKTRYKLEAPDLPSLTLRDAAARGYDGRPAHPPGRVEETNGISLTNISIDMWSMRVFVGRSLVDLGEGVTVQYERTADGYDAQITNGSPIALEDCVLVVGSRVIEVGALPAGATKHVTGLPRRVRGSPAALPETMLDKFPISTQQKRLRERVLAPVMAAASASGNSTDLALLGWSSKSLYPLEVNGRQVRERNAHLIYVHLPPPTNAG